MAGNRSRSHKHPNPQAQALNTRISLILVLLLGLHGVPGLAADGEILVDRLVAEVNGEPIPYSRVMLKVRKGPLVEVSPFPAKQEDPPFEIAMQDLINRKLVMQKAEEMGIEVSDDKLQQEVKRFLERRNLTMDSLMQALSQQGMSYEDYLNDFRNQMILNQFQGRVILPQIKISEKDVEVYYLRTSGQTSANQKVVLRQLLVRIPAGASAAVVKGKEELAARIYQELKDGMSFAEAVKVYSDNAGNRENGGLMPPLNLNDLAPAFRDVVKGLNEAEFSEPVRTPGGYFLFALEKKSVSESVDFKEKRKELEFKLRQEEIGKQTKKWLEDERRRSKIRVVADARP